MTPPARVNVLGPLTVEVGSTTLGPGSFGGLKPRQLFELLVLARGRPVTKDRLAEELWAEHQPHDAAATLEKYVSIVRRRLAPARLIETLPNAYRFVVESAVLDLDRFDSLLDEAARLGPTDSRPQLDAAVSIVRGVLLEDDPYAPWAESERIRYEERVVRAMLDSAASALACRDLDAARRHCELALSRDAVREEAFRMLMLVSYARGQQGEALRYFERCAAILSNELGVEPMPETERARQMIRAHVGIDELLPPVRRDQEPPAVVPGRPAHDRRVDLAGVLTAVDAALAGRRYGMVHVVGPAGAGKSRLLRDAAASVRSAAVGSAWCCRVERRLPFVPLTMALRAALPTDAPDPLAAVLSELSRYPDAAGQLRSLEELARTVVANGPTVLLLDDCHWADGCTLTALSYLRHRCQSTPFAVVLAFDPLLVPETHPLTALHPDAVVTLHAVEQEDHRPAPWTHPVLRPVASQAGRPAGLPASARRRQGWG